MAVLCIILGIIVFLLMVHPVVFWVVFVPLVILFVVSMVKFFRDGGLGLKHYVMAFVALAAMVVALLIVCIP